MDQFAKETLPVSLEEEMRRSYLDYAMSVIVGRALPDVRDGLKPVHRRVLYAMHEANTLWNRPYVKCARVVGDVMGKFHPHGDTAIYDTLVRMAQDFSMRYTLIDGQGNFGSIDGDNAAAMRYTEARLAKISNLMLEDLEKETVEWHPNFDNTLREPDILPAALPNLLINGSSGIAVGMATNIPPHNLAEVIDGCIAHLDNPEITIDELMQIIPGPDFPTGSQILGRAGIRSAYHKGRGSIVQRARVHVETIRKDREALIVTEIPYQVNKKLMIDKIGEMVKEKKIEGIADCWDETNRDGMRVVIELKRDAIADVVLNQLWRFSQLQQSFAANMVALNGGRPEVMTLKDMISAFTAFREDVVTRRTKYLLRKCRDRAHVLVGLAIAVANIDEVIALIRRSATPAVAKEGLMARDWPAKDMVPFIELIADPNHKLTAAQTYRLSDVQATAILALTLSRLTALGRDDIGNELQSIGGEIKNYLEILGSRARVIDIIKSEMNAIKAEFGSPRKSEILEFEGDVDDEDMINREDMVVTVSHKGYIKRVPLSTYRAQRRGGKGRSGMATREEDFVTRLFIASTHTPIVFFSSLGMAYKMKVWKLPLSTPTAIGKALVNLLPLSQGERITSILPLPEDEASWDKLDLMFATQSGGVRRNRLSDFVEVRQNGKIAMKLDDGDQIIGVAICSEGDDVLLTSAAGQAMRFEVTDVRVFKGRDSTGVRGIALAEGDKVISMTILRHFAADPQERAAYIKQRRAIAGAEAGEAATPEVDAEDEAAGEASLSELRYAEMSAAEQFVLTVSERGFGKRSSSFEYRVTNRGGKGIVGMIVNERNGRLIGAFPVEDADQIMLVTDGGQLIRCPVGGIRIAGRNTQGVTVFKTSEGEKVVAVEHIPDDGTGEGEGEPGGDVEPADLG